MDLISHTDYDSIKTPMKRKDNNKMKYASK